MTDSIIPKSGGRHQLCGLLVLPPHPVAIELENKSSTALFHFEPMYRLEDLILILGSLTHASIITFIPRSCAPASSILLVLQPTLQIHA